VGDRTPDRPLVSTRTHRGGWGPGWSRARDRGPCGGPHVRRPAEEPADPPPEQDAAGLQALFYEPLPYGSESRFNPVSSFLTYSIDTLQVPASFGTDGFRDGLAEVGRNLGSPWEAIEATGGLGRFVNRQVLPIDGAHLDEAVEMVPNYGLHLIGGGVVYRKNAEWLALHGVAYSRLNAALLSMATEYVQEAIEKPLTSRDDEVADMFIFRPLGILLFSWEPFARFWSERMHLVEWSSQIMIRPRGMQFANIGESYAIRPSVLGLDRHRPFFYFGLSPLIGLTHRLSETDSLSWGAGAAIREVTSPDFVIRLVEGSSTTATTPCWHR